MSSIQNAAVSAQQSSQSSGEIASLMENFNRGVQIATALGQYETFFDLKYIQPILTQVQAAGYTATPVTQVSGNGYLVSWGP